MDFDETALKAEISRISDKIDDIMAKVNRLYPLQASKSPSGSKVSENADDKQAVP
jgi:hypothetical protein